MSFQLSQESIKYLISSLTKVEHALDPAVKDSELSAINWMELHNIRQFRNLLQDIPEDRQSKCKTEMEVRSKIKEIEVYVELHIQEKDKWPDKQVHNTRASVLLQSISMCYWFLGEEMPKERNFHETEAANEVGIEHNQTGHINFNIGKDGYAQA